MAWQLLSFQLWFRTYTDIIPSDSSVSEHFKRHQLTDVLQSYVDFTHTLKSSGLFTITETKR